ncbi:MAG: SAM-dependent methyltransferase [Candidatus Muproteobacteria bacterium RBG_16_65_34]|uniref:SAM-dependent methyltransferase n=1 Tax=Candidatus Muproteobacteria bacterium RBG_16_65_34 TaxID=1817760 RepID=A0A1F6TLK6_9PROT|nr:MAG: SAM-dependent methyltransferase [Candidatus Muproteobacteria bacterium RBG_16_65_34]
MDLEAIEKVYRRYAPAYDLYFGALFQPGRRGVIERMRCRPGERILEVGVGTGLSLPLYPHHVQVTGIDLSREMLARAHERKARLHLDHVAALRCMDAEDMQFPDDSFDKVVAMYVVSVAPNPARLVEEMRRVCAPGGELYIVNHFHNTSPAIAALERLMAPFSKLMGFRPDLSLEQFIRDTGLEVIEKAAVNLFGYWTLLRARNNKPRRASEAQKATATADERR